MDANVVAIQSFADGRLGCGTIYKAANFKYYGFHYMRFLRNRRTGEFTHEQILTNTTSPSDYVRSNVAFLLGDLEVFVVKLTVTFILCASIFGLRRKKSLILNMTKEWSKQSGKETGTR